MWRTRLGGARTLTGGVTMNRAARFESPVLVLLAAIPLFCAAPAARACGRPGAFATASGGFRGPYTHGNLEVFLIRGSGPDLPMLTLQEAIEQKQVVVHETGSVNQ